METFEVDRFPSTSFQWPKCWYVQKFWIIVSQVLRGRPTVWRPLHIHVRMQDNQRSGGQVRSACMHRWQPCVRAQATLYKKKHYVRVMKATNSDSKTMPGFSRCFLPIPKLFSSGRKHIPFHPEQKEVGHIAYCWVASSPNSGRNHLCGGNVLMYAANFQYLIVTTADHGKNANWCTAVSMRACHECRISCQGADQSIPTGGGIMRRSIFRISMSYLRTSLGYSVRWPAAKQAPGVITALKKISGVNPQECSCRTTSTCARTMPEQRFANDGWSLLWGEGYSSRGLLFSTFLPPRKHSRNFKILPKNSKTNKIQKTSK